MCDPSTSYPCSWSRQAATEESTPPDIATSTDGMRRGYQRPHQTCGTRAHSAEPRIVATMLEARFDDLTGATPSFRLVGPVGVLEATRAGEVVAVLEAAEAAAGRGLWVAGFVSYEAAPGLDPALVVRSARSRGRVRRAPARVVRDVRARRGDHAPGALATRGSADAPTARGRRRLRASASSPPSSGSTS